ncbi:MAG: AI-2E family transporter [Candidatus Pacebacteria bacterium]|nr:AI-2E family transporter [Candidatus Paceibacterota bacterium]
MEKTEPKKGKLFFYILLAAVVILAAAIFRPFMIVLAISAALAVVLFPVYLWIRRRFAKNISWLAALITVLAFFIVLAVPLYFIGAKVVSEAESLYHSLADGGSGQQYVTDLVNWVHSVVPGSTEFPIREKISDMTSFITNSFGTIFTATIQTIFSLLLILLSLFYFLKDGEHFRHYLVRLSPLADRYDDKIFDKLAASVNGVMRGYVLIALVQGVLLGAGLWIFGVPNPVLWAVFAGIASMVPQIGTGVVSVPAILFLFFTGLPLHALGLLIWSLALVGTIDNILQPVVVGKNIDLPPIAVLFSVLGGVTLFGIAGLIIGPLSLSLFLTLMSIYREEYA